MVRLSPVRPDPLPYLNIPLIGLPQPCGSAGPTFPICRRSRRRIWPVTLQTRPRGADRTRSPAGVSRKREYFKYLPETINDFAPTAARFGARILIADSQKPAIGGLLSAVEAQRLTTPG